jgi:hypothetical protein
MQHSTAGPTQARARSSERVRNLRAQAAEALALKRRAGAARAELARLKRSVTDRRRTTTSRPQPSTDVTTAQNSSSDI